MHDLVVIGGGSGGVRAARLAAQAGLSVVLIERAALGGTCVNVGCVPKKFFVYAAHYPADFADARGYGWSTGETSFDWPTLRRNKDAAIERLNGVYARLLQDAGCQVVQGSATLAAADEVRVGSESFRTRHVLIATGGHPQRPDILGAEHGLVSDDIFSLEALPSQAIVVGGGYIAVEMAGILQGLGVEVTLVHRGQALLRGFDADLQRALAVALVHQGVRLVLGRRPQALVCEGDMRRLTLDDGSCLDAGLVLFATGRAPNTAGLGLEALGIPLSARGAIPVDSGYQSPIAGISALGDVIDRVALTPVAIAEAAIFVARLRGEAARELDYTGVPTAVFSQPPIGTVGLSEEAAREAGHRLRIFRSEFRPLKAMLSGRQERAMVKLVVDAESDRVLGAHLIGPDAGEIIQGFAVALNLGATKADFDRTIAIHPTLAEEFLTLREGIEDEPGADDSSASQGGRQRVASAPCGIPAEAGTHGPRPAPGRRH